MYVQILVMKTKMAYRSRRAVSPGEKRLASEVQLWLRAEERVEFASSILYPSLVRLLSDLRRDW